MEVLVVPPIGMNEIVLDLISKQGTAVGEKDGFSIGNVPPQGADTIHYAELDGETAAYAVTRTIKKSVWVLEMFSLPAERGKGAMRAVLRHLVSEYKEVAIDKELSQSAIEFLESMISAGQFAAKVADYHNHTMVSYNRHRADHQAIPIYDRPYMKRPANPDPEEYGWVLTEGMARDGLLTPNTFPRAPEK